MTDDIDDLEKTVAKATHSAGFDAEVDAKMAEMMARKGSEKLSSESKFSLNLTAATMVAITRLRAGLDTLEQRHETRLSELSEQVRALESRLVEAETAAAAKAAKPRRRASLKVKS